MEKFWIILAVYLVVGVSFSVLWLWSQKKMNIYIENSDRKSMETWYVWWSTINNFYKLWSIPAIWFLTWILIEINVQEGLGVGISMIIHWTAVVQCCYNDKKYKTKLKTYYKNHYGTTESLFAKVAYWITGVR